MPGQPRAPPGERLHPQAGPPPHQGLPGTGLLLVLLLLLLLLLLLNLLLRLPLVAQDTQGRARGGSAQPAGSYADGVRMEEIVEGTVPAPAS